MIKLILWDEKPIVLHEGDLSLGTGHYHGITWNNDALFVSASVDTKYIIHVFDKDSYHLIDTLSDADLHSVHQIHWFDGKLYVTNTGLNRIEILHNGRWEHFAWKTATWNIDHINGIWTNGGKFYIVEFRNRGSGDERLKSCVRICDRDFNTLDKVGIGRGIHNIYVENRKLYTLISTPPQIVEYGFATKSIKSIPLQNVENGLIRGMARTVDFWYIGVSRWETEKNNRHVGDAIILQLDNRFEEVERIVMPDFGPVCEIRVIDEVDKAHNGINYHG